MTASNERYFPHDRLDVYRAAVEFERSSRRIIALLPRSSHLADQLHRAATSVPLNIAEGAGEFSPKDKARFYRIALRSATESAAILDLVGPDLGEDSCDMLALRDLLVSIVAMLTKLVATQANR
jgi:four helix bundle protein